jgi:hypothetical protein
MPARSLFVSAVIVVACASVTSIPIPAATSPSVFVDDQGVMRWTSSKEEVALFGVNYTTPFAHAFRAHQRLGIPPEKGIDADVYHLARLGLDAYRVHIWDREISDAEGNLVVNDHVRAHDYLVAQLKARGIKIVLTPLQFGNAGYPEAGVPLPGFSSKYGKRGCLEDRTSWPLQERYLAQFASHVNPHTGLAPKDDPDIIAFEICNEPGHFEYATTLEYINRMVQALRDAGCAQPIFYNMSHGLDVFEAYLDANVQGGTFQWYPANLLAGHEQRGNFLPYLEEYPIPFAKHPKFKTKARLIYEFDPADLGRSYTYPAMARVFRQIGAQFATQFAYDTMAIAPFNTEYQTHYLNLAYAPSKALSLMIAAEAFRRMPRFKDYGAYPRNTTFAGVRLSYEHDLADFVSDETFIYTNNTISTVPGPTRLQKIAGHGNSAYVGYAGRGAYFLDRLEPGVWRLEVMPDAICVRDPYEQASPLKHVSRIAWNEWPMRINLHDLGANFSAVGLNDGNTYRGTASDTTLPIRPGAYLLTRSGVQTSWQRDSKFGVVTLKEFVAPPASLDRTYVLHQPDVEATAGRNLTIIATIAAPQPVTKVELVALFPIPPRPGTADTPPTRAQPGGGNTPGPGGVPYRQAGEVFAMTSGLPADGFMYSVRLPGDRLPPGTLRYHIVVHTADGATTFPSGTNAIPSDWRFFGDPWTVRIVPTDAPVLLFDAATDSRHVTANDRESRYELVPSDRPGTSAMEVIARDLTRSEHDHSCRSFFKDRIRARTEDLAGKQQLVLYGKSATDQPCRIQLALITTDGIAYGAATTVAPQHGVFSVPLDKLRQVRLPNIPHGYPSFIPFWSSVTMQIPFDVKRIESVLISVGPEIAAPEYDQPHGVQIERIWLE